MLTHVEPVTLNVLLNLMLSGCQNRVIPLQLCNDRNSCPHFGNWTITRKGVLEWLFRFSFVRRMGQIDVNDEFNRFFRHSKSRFEQ